MKPVTGATGIHRGGNFSYFPSTTNTNGMGIQGRKTNFMFRVMASSKEHPSEFAKNMERAWSISHQPRPIGCSSCNAKGHIECKWCRGTGFFILGDNVLCEVPSRNTNCVICMGEGLSKCSDCKGTGFRAKWLDQPTLNKA